MGQISAIGFTNGNSDILVAGLTRDGQTKFVEYLGNTISETPGDITYNDKAKQLNLFMNTNSVAFNN